MRQCPAGMLYCGKACRAMPSWLFPRSVHRD
jgi:hypothetical protein